MVNDRHFLKMFFKTFFLLQTRKKHSMTYRSEIDGLRALAVLAVVFFHLFPSSLPGGFIGVDVFFVISGYLITTIIFTELDKDTFTFTSFFSRRIRRIFPALILVMAVSLGFGWFALLSDEYEQLGKHVASGSAFLLNFVLVNESGYFDNIANTKPMLHLWSLAVEEQFYIIWPLALYLAWRRSFNLLRITIAVATISFYMNLKFSASNPTGAFFWPIGRFWELLSGSILSWLMIYKRDFLKIIRDLADNILVKTIFNGKVNSNGSLVTNLISGLGFLFIFVGIFIINEGHVFPGILGLAPVLGALLIIISGSKALLNRVLLMNPLAVWFGLISYPLYLWHWPLITFYKITVNEELSIIVALGILFITITASYLTYKYVESPIRRNKYKLTSLILFFMVLTGATGLAIYKSDGVKSRSTVANNSFVSNLDWPYWINMDCAKKYNLSPCQASNSEPRIMILGDSHANHLYPGLKAALPKSTGLYSGGTCPPLQGISITAHKNPTHICKDNRYLGKNIDLIEKSGNFATILISAQWTPLLVAKASNEISDENWHGLILTSNYEDESNLSAIDIVYEGLKRTITTLSDRDLDIIFVRDVPNLPTDIRNICVERFYSRKTNDNCSLKLSEFNKQRQNESRLIHKLNKDFNSIKVYDPFTAICKGDECFLVHDHKPLFRDSHHLSVYGSKLIGKDIQEKFNLE